MPELADIFRRHGPEYLEKFGERILPSHRRAIQDIADCRTETLGGHLVQCDFCGYLDYYAPLLPQPELPQMPAKRNSEMD